MTSFIANKPSSSSLPLAGAGLNSDVENIQNPISKLIQKMRAKTNPSGSFVASPIGLQSTLDVLMQLHGKEKAEVALKQLGVEGLTLEKYHSVVLENFKRLNCQFSDVLEIANQRFIFLDKKLSVTTDFQKAAKELCESGIGHLGTSSENSVIVQQTNGKVNNISRGLLPQLLKPSDLDDAKLFFCDVLYFDAMWAEEWNVSPDDFKIGNESICCEFMNVKTTARICFHELVQVCLGKIQRSWRTTRNLLFDCATH